MGDLIDLSLRTNDATFLTPEMLIRQLQDGTRKPMPGANKVVVVFLADEGDHNVQIFTAGSYQKADHFTVAAILQHDALQQLGYAPDPGAE